MEELLLRKKDRLYQPKGVLGLSWWLQLAARRCLSIWRQVYFVAQEHLGESEHFLLPEGVSEELQAHLLLFLRLEVSRDLKLCPGFFMVNSWCEGYDIV